MKLKSILTSQAIRFYTPVEPLAERRSPVPLIRGLQDKYGFVQVPLTVAELDFTKGVTFLRGYYKGIIIDKLQVYENGLLCEAMADTAACDLFMSEVLNWATTEHGISVSETGVKAFVSQLEITTDVDLGAMFHKLRPLGAMLAKALKGYGQPVADFSVSGIKMHYDSMSVPIPRAPEFAFERRAGQLYASNEFFTTAPLSTQDHLRLLNELEKLY